MSNTLVTLLRNKAATHSYLYSGPVQNTFAMTQKADIVGLLELVGVDPEDSLKAVSVGSGIAYFSIDGGTTWAVATGMGTTGPLGQCRKILFLGSGKVMALSLNYMYYSTDSGATWTNTTPAFLSGTGSHMQDVIFLPTNSKVILLLSSIGGLVSGAQTFSAPAPFTTWTLDKDFTVLGWVSPRELPVRLAVRPTTDNVLLLTSHKLYQFSNYSGATGHLIAWDYWTPLHIADPLIPEAGYQSGAELNTLFDQIEVLGSNVWLGGYHDLRGHSISGSAFVFSNPTAITNMTVDPNYIHNLAVTPSKFYTTSNRPPTPAPATAGVWRSGNQGVTVVPWSSFDPDLRAIDTSVSRAVVVVGPPPPVFLAGCTDNNACNYETGLTNDDGTCSYAVQLQSCANNRIVYGSSQELHALACRGPRFALEVLVSGTVDPQVIRIYGNGVALFSFTWISPDITLSIPDQTQAFINALIGYLNANTPYNAVHIPPSQNVLSPGSLNGVWIDYPSGSGKAITELSLGLITVLTSSTVDSGSSGAIVKLLEFPDDCWTVCGAGDCSLAQQYHITSVYTDCTSCTPKGTAATCFDCSGMVTRQDGSIFIPTPTDLHVQCVVAGEIVTVHPSGSFPSGTSTVLIPLNPGTSCNGAAPVSVDILGDHRLDFPIGSYFTTDTTATSEHTEYRVSSSTFSALTGITTVISVGFCTSGSAIDTLTSFSTCDCTVSVTINSVVGVDATPLVSQEYPCVSGSVDQSFNWTVPNYGTYNIVMVSSACGVEKTCTYWMDACEDYKAVNTACHTYQIRINRPAGAPVTTNNIGLKVTDRTTGVALLDEQVAENLFPATVVLPGDGFYQATVTKFDGTTTVVDIIDLCDILACRKKLTLEIMCGGDDPCDKSCQNDPSKQQMRQEIARIGLLTQELESAIGGYRYSKLGLMDLSETVEDRSNDIAQLIATIRQVSSRCAVCQSVM